MKGFYPRTVTVCLVIAVGIAFSLSGWRLEAWEAMLPLFDWMETTVFGRIGQTWGAAFAVVQAFHLLGLALLGGAVLLADGRLLGWWFTGTGEQILEAQSHTLFRWALILLVITGIFMACGVANKIYYLPVFWFKMLALGIGVAFAWGIRRPWVQQLDGAGCATTKLVGAASIMVWFTVAATGRWIGFSG